MPLIDTLTLKTGLLEGGMPEPQAAAIVRALADADVGQLATKSDLAELRAEVGQMATKSDLAELRAEVGQMTTRSNLAELRAEVRTEIANVRTKVEAVRADVRAEISDVRTEVASVRTEVEAVRGDFKALNGKVNLLLAFAPLVLAARPALAGLFRRDELTPHLMAFFSLVGRPASHRRGVMQAETALSVGSLPRHLADAPRRRLQGAAGNEPGRPPMSALFRVVVLTALLMAALGAQAWAADLQAGVEAYDRGDYAAALREFRPLAEQGHALGQYGLGFMYANGRGVPRNDAEAAKWYYMAAEQGEPAAQNALRKAAERGNAEAQYHLGVLYRWGYGVPQDHREAVKWFRKAAEQGDMHGQSSLGFMYAGGLGVPKDAVQAHAWITIGDAQGADADIALEVMRSQMSREEIARARQLARQYWNAYVEPFR